MKILAINPGSTSTKIAVFENGENIFQNTLRHTADEINKYSCVVDQFGFRKDVILNELKNAGISVDDINVVVGRGGLVKPIESGVYEVNELLKDDSRSCRYGEHASNLGALIADDIAKSLPSAKAYITDPVVVDELQDEARVTGLPFFTRKSVFHALNQKATARAYANEVGKKYEEMNLIIAHLGGGVSVGAHRLGRVVDVNNAVDGDGPLSPERSGTLPTGQLVELCFSGKYSQAEVKKLLCGTGGMVAYFGVNDAQQVAQKAEKGEKAELGLMNGFSYQIGKSIGAAAAVLYGKVDGIIITGGIAYNKIVTDYVEKMVKFIAPVKVYPGENEMAALAENVKSALEGNLPIKKYV